MDDLLAKSAEGALDLFHPWLRDLTSLLDVGTGTSIPMHIIAGKYPDLRTGTLDIVDRRHIRKLPFDLYDGGRMPYGDRSFDAALLNETLHHCQHQEKVLRESKRVADLLYVVEHFPLPHASMDDLRRLEQERLQSLNLDCPIYRPFTRDSFKHLLGKAGLIVVDTKEVPYRGEREIEKFCFKLV